MSTVSVIQPTYSGIYAQQLQSFLAAEMIVTRMQNHMVETADGDFYAIVNLGYAGDLAMISSTGGGAYWSEIFPIPDTNILSSADVQLEPDGQTLLTTYLNAQNQVVFQEYSYDDADQTWDPGTYAIVQGSGLNGSVHPTIVMNGKGTLLVAYTNLTLSGLELEVDASVNGGNSWFPLLRVTDPLAYKGSARLVEIDGKADLVYTVDNTVNFASYSPATGFTTETILSYGTDQKDFYASHFSTLVDGSELLIATDDGDHHLVVLEYDAQTGQWSVPYGVLALNFATGAWTAPENSTGGSAAVTYAQLTLAANGDIFVTYDDSQSNVIDVAESTDGGATFKPYAILALPPSNAGFPTRIIAPEYGDNSFVVMAQVRDPANPDAEALLSYVVPVGSTGNTPTIVSVAEPAVSAQAFSDRPLHAELAALIDHAAAGAVEPSLGEAIHAHAVAHHWMV